MQAWGGGGGGGSGRNVNCPPGLLGSSVQRDREKRGRKERERDRGEINIGLLGSQYHKLEIKLVCKLTVYCYYTD